MRHLLNTLFVMTEGSYLSLENENVVINGKIPETNDDKILGRLPLIGLENILYFGYRGVSPALMGECAKRNIGLCFFRPSGRFLARVVGESHGNVLLRKKQYQISDDEDRSCRIAKNFIVGKIHNCRSIIERFKRDHPLNIDVKKFEEISRELISSAREARAADSLDELRGIEGNAAHLYFSVFGDFILQNKKDFPFEGRFKRPPIGRVNAAISFFYTILAHDCASALEAVGLDAYVGFLHRVRPGRESLALDLMEELRSIAAERFVITLINNRMLTAKDFDEKENGVTFLSDSGRKKTLGVWQERKRDTLSHPYIGEKISWGLVPYVQALLLARHLRGDLDEYPAFLWK